VGGFIAWTLGALHPDVTRAVAPVAMAHPLRLRAALLHDRRQRRSGWYAVGFQRPFVPEHQLTTHDAARVEQILRARSATSTWPSPEEAATYRAAMLTPATAHCAVEFHRWALRSIPRRDGRRFTAAIREPVTVPVLQLHGREDPAILPSTVDGSEAYVTAAYRREDLDCGHFPQEERGDEVSEALLGWLATLPAPTG
jgi:pimeloyl-ACP methyl ester carboxylesterase